MQLCILRLRMPPLKPQFALASALSTARPCAKGAASHQPGATPTLLYTSLKPKAEFRDRSCSAVKALKLSWSDDCKVNHGTRNNTEKHGVTVPDIRDEPRAPPQGRTRLVLSVFFRVVPCPFLFSDLCITVWATPQDRRRPPKSRAVSPPHPDREADAPHRVVFQKSPGTRCILRTGQRAAGGRRVAVHLTGAPFPVRTVP